MIGNWEGGYRDKQGRWWTHVPYEGWTVTRHRPYLLPAARKSWRARCRSLINRRRNR